MVREWSSQGQKHKGLFIENAQVITKVEFCSYFYDHKKGTCYGFMVRQLIYHKTLYGQSVETIYNV